MQPPPSDVELCLKKNNEKSIHIFSILRTLTSYLMFKMVNTLKIIFANQNILQYNAKHHSVSLFFRFLHHSPQHDFHLNIRKKTLHPPGPPQLIVLGVSAAKFVECAVFNNTLFQVLLMLSFLICFKILVLKLDLVIISL